MARPSHGPVQPLVETRRSDPMSLLAAARVPCAHQQRPWLRARGARAAADAGLQARTFRVPVLQVRATPAVVHTTPLPQTAAAATLGNDRAAWHRMQVAVVQEISASVRARRNFLLVLVVMDLPSTSLVRWPSTAVGAVVREARLKVSFMVLVVQVALVVVVVERLLPTVRQILLMELLVPRTPAAEGAGEAALLIPQLKLHVATPVGLAS